MTVNVFGVTDHDDAGSIAESGGSRLATVKTELVTSLGVKGHLCDKNMQGDLSLN